MCLHVKKLVLTNKHSHRPPPGHLWRCDDFLHRRRQMMRKYIPHARVPQLLAEPLLRRHGHDSLHTGVDGVLPCWIFHAKLQETLMLWDKLMEVNGAAIAPDKCWWYTWLVLIGKAANGNVLTQGPT